MQLLGKLQYLGVAVAASGLPSVYMALGSFKNGHNFSCVSNFSYLYSYVLFNSDIFLLSACNTLFKNQCLDLKRHTQLFSGAEIFFFCNYILKHSFCLSRGSVSNNTAWLGQIKVFLELAIKKSPVQYQNVPKPNVLATESGFYLGFHAQMPTNFKEEYDIDCPTFF